MFTDFLYLLRSYGMKTSLNEWNSLMDALEMNLNDASLTEFYYMARAVLVKKESEYDKFDQAFLAYFKNVQTFEELPKEVLDWLSKAHAQTPYDKDEVDARFAGLDLDDIRQFQVALKKLRLLSCREDGPKTELNVEKTIEKTCDEGGRLELVMERPRKNQTKLLLLMDSGGSMWAYADLCNRLFQAVNQSSHFKDLKIYYFHNCFYDQLFTTPSCSWRDKISTEWVFHNLKPEYKVILVGDASMAPSELLYRGGSLDYFHSNERTGIYWLQEMHRRFPSAIWLNPMRENNWAYAYGAYTISLIREEIPMFPLTAAGLEAGIKELKK